MLSFLFGPKALDAQTKTIYDFKVTALDGGTIDLSKYKGKKILIVNTASKCGYTPQYEGLQKLYEKYKDQLVIIGFPANNFLFQEPGNNETIQSFCQKNYGVTFPMAAKISVKGRDMHPVYVWLTQKKYNGFSDNSVKWNFQKYLIDENGKLIEVFAPGVEPMSAEITGAISK
ncbi:MAG: glutathione peroxidase [Chitinophagaceae bacterium]|nr:glutathione peroxidase [Chitinophagaceae bacterium]